MTGYEGDAAMSYYGRVAREYWSAFQAQLSIAVYHHGLRGCEAETWAVDCLVINWMNTNLPHGPGIGLTAGVCAECKKPLGRIGRDAVPFGDKAWLHWECTDGWKKRREQEARRSILGETFNQESSTCP